MKGHQPDSSREQKKATQIVSRRKSSRRDVMRLGLLVGVGLPLVVTLTPTEAQAYSS